jgi:hypothetical protein
VPAVRSQDGAKPALGTPKTGSGGGGAMDPSIPAVPSPAGKGWRPGDEWAAALGRMRTEAKRANG